MEHTLDEEDLYVALSDLFVASNIDYENIASVARQFPIKHVEYVLFNYIAPICHYNVIPSYCMAFDSTSIIHAVNNIKKHENRFINKIKMHIFAVYFKFEFKDEWQKLKSLL
ncbi:hypothetical protein GASC598B02_008160 [Gilliamella apicola SCGC AB-598-B02]|nr:hypothetical protein GASC598B02_006320 [Gilliamella apicola SCGC AB-598-B02]KES15522.1 hypothetical protein GASC598B02_006340 [Gilliamella apicola SCGC AB-598-B02]KES16974.1 hypothetical protein GASC598B02_007560 [Gilliamella apicola SCGC AB-598-B02]KES17169.1 hypothetical protein GASC598B02_008160 [Gilliamella apicola SCGC AB-598-B02]